MDQVDVNNTNQLNLSLVSDSKPAMPNLFPGNQNKALNPFYVDYGEYAGDDGRFVWAFNSGYSAADTTILSINYAAVKLTEPFGGYYDPADVDGSKDIIIDYPNLGLRVDSIFIPITHENNSGQYDKITAKLIQLAANGNPSATSAVLWSQTDSTNTTLSPCGNWLGTGCRVIMTYTPGFVIAAGTKAAIQMEYFGSKLDSFSIAATFLKDPSDPLKATKSLYPNSYTRIPPNIPNITLNSNIGYGSPVGSNGWFRAQNWQFIAYVNFIDDVSVEETSAKGIAACRVFPNPTSCRSNLEITLSKPSEVFVSIHDLAGRMVRKIVAGKMVAGTQVIPIDLSNFESGVYAYTIHADGVMITDKVMIAK
jgi:hypothetical protein